MGLISPQAGFDSQVRNCPPASGVRAASDKRGDQVRLLGRRLRPSTRTGIAVRSRAWRLWVRLPPWSLRTWNSEVGMRNGTSWSSFRVPHSPFRARNGSVVQQEDTRLACEKSGCNSRRFHSRGAWSRWSRRLSCKQKIRVRLPAVPLAGLWSNGKTPQWHCGDPGSIPGKSNRGWQPEGSRTLVRRSALLTRAASHAVRVRFPPLPLTVTETGGECKWLCHLAWKAGRRGDRAVWVRLPPLPLMQTPVSPTWKRSGRMRSSSRKRVGLATLVSSSLTASAVLSTSVSNP